MDIIRNRRILMVHFLFALSLTLQAQTWNGSGGNGNWSDDANWNGGTAPVSSDSTDLVFDGTTELSVNNDISDPFLLRDMTFSSSAGDFILSGGALELYGDIINDASGVQTIANDIELMADSTWTIDSGEIIFAGNMISNPSLLTVDGPGTLTLTGNNALYLKNEGIKGDATVCIKDGTTTQYGSGTHYLFTKSAGQSFIITNGAKFVSMNNPLVKYENSAIVSGTGSVWDGNGTSLLYMRTDGSLLVNDGAVVTNFAEFNYGGGSSEINISVQDGGKIFAEKANFYQGKNDLDFTIGGTNSAGEKALVKIASSFPLGTTYTCNNNMLLVDADGELDVASDIFLGYGWNGIGTNNAMIVTNGGQVFSHASTYGTRIGSSNSSTNYVLISGTHPITGLPSKWDPDGKIWLCYDNDNRANRITVNNGGVLTNATVLVGETRNNAAGTPYAARVEILDGGRCYGSLQLGYSGSDNTALISGGGATLNSQGKILYVGIFVNATNNILTVDGKGVAGGAVVTNTDYIYVGYINNKRNTYVKDNSMIVTNGGHIYSGDDLYIGYIPKATATNETAYNNSVVVSGDGSLLDVNNQPVRVGYIDNSLCYGFDNGLIIEDSGIVTNASTIQVGYTRTGAVASNNYICAAGGDLYATDMTIYSTNLLKVVLGPQTPEEFGCINISGTATFESDTFISPSAKDGAEFGTYTILKAGVLDATGLALDPSVDSSRWNLIIEDNTIKLSYETPGSVFIIR